MSRTNPGTLSLLLAGYLAIGPTPARGAPAVRELAPPAAPAPAVHEAIARGAALWHTPPPGAQAASCALCHADPTKPPTWAGSFPKVKPSFGTSLQVRTLEQAIRIAISDHYRLNGQALGEAGRDLAAYLTWRGRGRPLTPGREDDRQVFPDRLRALERAGGRGQEVFATRCSACHRAADVAEGAVWFPRAAATDKPVTADAFLRLHARDRADLPLGPDDQALADLVAYLARARVGQLLGP